MPTKKKKPNPADNGLLKMLTESAAPQGMRIHLLENLTQSGEQEARKTLIELLDAAGRGLCADPAAKKAAELDKLIKTFQQGPLRSAMFVKMVSLGDGTKRAQVVLEDGSRVLCAVADEQVAKSLRVGGWVLLEAEGKAVLFAGFDECEVGEEAQIERRVGRERVEVKGPGDQLLVLTVSDELRNQLDEEMIGPGDRVITSPIMRMAFRGPPKQDGLSHFRFLDLSPVPDVVVERDIGSPPAYIGVVLEHVRTAMERPDLLAKYGVRLSTTAMLEGPPGCGKTYSIDGLHNALVTLIAEVTGLPVGEIPPLVIRVRPGKVLSSWLGQSDANLERVFDEAEQLSAEGLVGKDGRRHNRPVLVIFEEVESLARTRGSDHEAVYDRIQTTLLQRLDPASHSLADRLLIVVGTTNVGALVDRAFLRRIGGISERFAHLDRRASELVLEKQLGRRPVKAQGGEPQPAARKRLAIEITAWLYSQNSDDPGQLEVHPMGASDPTVKYRRDFLTAGLIDRALQQASREAMAAERTGHDGPNGKGGTGGTGGTGGLTAFAVMRAIDTQVRAIVERITEQNVRQYLPLQDGQRIASVRKLPASALAPFELERTA